MKRPVIRAALMGGAAVLSVIVWNTSSDPPDMAAAAPRECLRKVATIQSSDPVVIGTSGNDVIVTGKGDDRVLGLGGNDRLCGNRGDDTLFGGEGHDRVNGGRAVDFCEAEIKKKCEDG